MEENVTILTIPLSQNSGSYSDVWIGIPNIQSSIYVGLQKKDGLVWYGYHQDDNHDRNWPDFISDWYTANIYAKALEQCVGIEGGNPLLSRCSSVFVLNKTPYAVEESEFVLQFLPNGQQDVEELLNQLPPIEYIEKVVSLAKIHGLLFDSDMLRVFLERYEEKTIPLTILQNLDHYDKWRMKLT